MDVAKLHDCQKNIIDPNLSKSRQLTDVSINNSVFDFCRVELINGLEVDLWDL